MSRLRDIPDQQGFTIIELMIATAVLSTILLLTTIIMISIGNLYYKGVNQSRIQDDARSIADQVSQDLKLTDSPAIQSSAAKAGITYQAYCIGDVRYSYVIGYRNGSPDSFDTTTLPHVLWRDDANADITDQVNSGATGCQPMLLTTSNLDSNDPSGSELIAPNSRLTDFTISSTLGGPYNLAVGVAYGDADLLSLTGNLNTLNVTCNGSVGDQFCATSDLQTTVTQRITGGP